MKGKYELDVFQKDVALFFRAFGMHKLGQTPCGEKMSVSEAHALLALMEEEPLTQSKLAVQLGLTKSTVSRLVGLMILRGWIDRTLDPEDSRRVNLRLTTKGSQSVTKLVTSRAKYFKKIMNVLSPQDHPHIVCALRALTIAAKKANEK